MYKFLIVMNDRSNGCLSVCLHAPTKQSYKNKTKKMNSGAELGHMSPKGDALYLLHILSVCCASHPGVYKCSRCLETYLLLGNMRQSQHFTKHNKARKSRRFSNLLQHIAVFFALFISFQGLVCSF